MHDFLLAALAQPRLKELRDLGGPARPGRPRTGRRRRARRTRRMFGITDRSAAIVLPERRPAA
jgi:hypothetical protein